MSPFRTLRPFSLVTVVALAACQAPPSSPPGEASRYVVAMQEGAEREALIQAIEAAGGHVSADLDQIGVLQVEATDPGFLEAVRARPEVAVAGLNQRHRYVGKLVASKGGDLDGQMPPKTGPGGEPLSGYQWGLDAGHVPEAWTSGFKGRGTVVAVLDSGVDASNRDLAANLDMAHGRSFVPSEPDLVDYNGHGSHVAGIIAAAQNGYGVVGVAPEATILPVKVLDKTGYGEDWDILKGINYAVGQGASIINLSLSGLVERNSAGAHERSAYASAIRYAQSRGAIVVTASGNEGLEFPSQDAYVLPAEAGEALVIGATGPVNGQNPLTSAFYSNYGQGFLSLVAPGGGMGFDTSTMTPIVTKTDLVLSTWSTKAVPREEMGFKFGPTEHMFLGGTSMATAYVSGVAALARSSHGPVKPALLKDILIKAVQAPADASHYGAGPIDARLAIQH